MGICRAQCRRGEFYHDATLPGKSLSLGRGGPPTALGQFMRPVNHHQRLGHPYAPGCAARERAQGRLTSINAKDRDPWWDGDIKSRTNERSGGKTIGNWPMSAAAIERDLITRYATPLPRYTSYPTANHFSSAVDAKVYGDWLAQLPATPSLSLYLHIPYCRELCWYCGCSTKAVRRYEPVTEYLRLLCREVSTVGERLPERHQVTHLHWGGGSPDILSPEDIVRLGRGLQKTFHLATGAEHAVEVDPRLLNTARAAAFAEVGINRVSIGVQDFDEAVQKAIGRIQGFDVTRQAVRLFRERGIHSINIDLVYGLPHQTTASVLRTVDKVLGLEPDRIAVFGYAHLPSRLKHQRLIDKAALPNAAARHEQSTRIAERLVAAGYVQVGLDHFAQPSDPLATAALHRNFQGYTTDEAPVLIGLGASSIGALPQGYAANEIAIDRYKETVREGRLPVTRGIAVTGEDRLRRAIIERLMCDMSVDLEEIALMHDVEAESFDADLSRLAPLEADGIVIRSGRRLELTDEGRPLVRAVCAVFDEYLGKGAARHSKAV